MVTEIKDLPPHVAGIIASGEVTGEQLKEVLIPALDELVTKTGEINYLLILESDISNWDFSAWVNDMKAGLKHLSKWNRIAVVSDQNIVNKFTDFFGFFVPNGARGFELSAVEEAKSWVAKG